MNPIIPYPAMVLKVRLLFFEKNSFDIKYPTSVDMPLNKETNNATRIKYSQNQSILKRSASWRCGSSLPHCNNIHWCLNITRSTWYFHFEIEMFNSHKYRFPVRKSCVSTYTEIYNDHCVPMIETPLGFFFCFVFFWRGVIKIQSQMHSVSHSKQTCQLK